MTPISAIVLAGGASRRMGRPKALVELGGETLVERAARRLGPLGDDVVVVAAAHVALPAGPGFRVVEDEVPGLGPVAGIAAGLRAARHDTALVTGVDLPFVDLGLVARLRQRLGDRDLCVPRWRGRLEPLVGVYRARLLPVLEAMLASGRAAARAIAERAPAAFVEEDEVRAVDPQGLSFFDVDTPEALEEARRLEAGNRGRW